MLAPRFISDHVSAFLDPSNHRSALFPIRSAGSPRLFRVRTRSDWERRNSENNGLNSIIPINYVTGMVETRMLLHESVTKHMPESQNPAEE